MHPQSMHQSFVDTASHLRGWAEDSGADVRGNDLLSAPAVPGKLNNILQLFIIIQKYVIMILLFKK